MERQTRGDERELRARVERGECAENKVEKEIEREEKGERNGKIHQNWGEKCF